MAIKRPDLDTNHIVNLYNSGLTSYEIAAQLGTTAGTVCKRLARAGTTIRTSRLDLDESAIVDCYTGGTSENQVAKKFRISRSVVRRILIARGVQVRGQSDAERLKWSQMTRAQRLKQVSRSHGATRGRTVSRREKALRAATIRRNGTTRGLSSPTEIVVNRMLSDCCIDATWQLPVGPYNVDFGSESARVAVEVVGTWPKRSYLPTLGERTKYLLDLDWSILFIDMTNKIPVDDTWVCKNLISHFQVSGTDKPDGGRYWVIRCDGKDPAGLRSKLYDVTGVECSSGRIERSAH